MTRTAAGLVRKIIRAAIAAHAVEPELHRIFTIEGARLGLPAIVTPVDASLAEEAAKWAKRVRAKRPNAELALWLALAQTAAHAVIHAAFVERPDVTKDEAFVEEVTRLVVRYLE